MTQMVLRKPERDIFNQIDSLIINRSNKRLKNLLLEAIEKNRFDRVFNYRYRGECKIGE